MPTRDRIHNSIKMILRAAILIFRGNFYLEYDAPYDRILLFAGDSAFGSEHKSVDENVNGNGFDVVGFYEIPSG